MRATMLIKVGFSFACSAFLLNANAVAERAEISIGRPDCTECAIDLFAPDLSGDWAEYCSVVKKAGYTLQFEQTGVNYLVSSAGHSCELTDIADYNRMERRYIVQKAEQCTPGAPTYLIAEYRLNEDNQLEVKSRSQTKSLIDCSVRKN